LAISQPARLLFGIVPYLVKQRIFRPRSERLVPDRLEEEAGLLDIVNVSAMRGNHGLQVCEVALRVHYCLPGHAA
jgi:hypothetical protein